MPKIRDDVVRAVLDRARIEDVVGEFVTLRKAGVNMTGICPFHDDKHDGNFIVRPSTISEKDGGNTYKCFVCEKKGGPVKFLMDAEHMTFPDAIRWIGRKYCVDVDDVPMNWTPPPPKPLPPPLPRLTFKRKTVLDSMQGIGQTWFVRWLYTLPWSNEQRERLADVLHLYCVARCPHGPEWVSFWQITHEGIPLTAKYMKYHEDGHRVKDKLPDGSKVFASDWEHAWRARKEQYDRSKYDVSGRALFGCHLLNRYPEAAVNIVESEKTALIMATFYGHPEQQLWLACGGIEYIKLDMMQPLIDLNRKVWLWPDKDGVTKWQQLADKLGSDRVQVYTRFFETCWREEDGPKADCADIIIRMMTNGDKPREVKHTGDPQSTTETIATASDQSGVKSAATPKPNSDEPFLDPEELADPRVREWREKMSHCHSSGWGKWPKSKVEGVKSVGEVLQEHPIIKKLIE